VCIAYNTRVATHPNGARQNPVLPARSLVCTLHVWRCFAGTRAAQPRVRQLHAVRLSGTVRARVEALFVRAQPRPRVAGVILTALTVGAVLGGVRALALVSVHYKCIDSARVLVVTAVRMMHTLSCNTHTGPVAVYCCTGQRTAWEVVDGQESRTLTTHSAQCQLDVAVHDMGTAPQPPPNNVNESLHTVLAYVVCAGVVVVTIGVARERAQILHTAK
jgi:hypothetical protein